MKHSKDYSHNVLKKIDEDLQDSDNTIKELKAHTEVNAIKTGRKLEYGKAVGTMKRKGHWKEVHIISIGTRKTTSKMY